MRIDTLDNEFAKFSRTACGSTTTEEIMLIEAGFYSGAAILAGMMLQLLRDGTTGDDMSRQCTEWIMECIARANREYAEDN